MAPKPPQKTICERLTRLIDSEEEEINLERDPSRRKMRINTLATLLSELRKAEAAEHKKHSALTKATILDWFRNADPTEAARFHKELGQLFVKRSGLA